MGASDGAVVGLTKIVDAGPPAKRWNLVIVAEGYRKVELPKFAIDARSVAVGTVLTEARDAGEDDPRVERFELRVVDAESRLDVGAKIFDDDVGFCDERTKQCRTIRVLQIDADAALVAMQVLDVGTVTRAGDGAARGVTRRRRFDLDDVRTPVGE